jgi:hypothetical protein
MVTLLVLALAAQTPPVSLQCDGVLSRGDAQSVSRALVEIDGQAVRVQAPPEMFATFTGNRQPRWRNLSGVAISEREVRGHNAPTPVGRMEVVISRMTGDIRITVRDAVAGSSSFVGDCEVVPTAPLF